MNKQKIVLIKQIHSLHLKDPLRKNAKRFLVRVQILNLCHR